MNVRTVRRRGGSRIAVSGRLTVEGAVAFRDELLAAAARRGNVTLFLGEVERVDLSFLQLACAACRTLGEDGRAVVLDGEGVEAVRAKAVLAGLPGECGGASTCLWRVA